MIDLYLMSTQFLTSSQVFASYWHGVVVRFTLRFTLRFGSFLGQKLKRSSAFWVCASHPPYRGVKCNAPKCAAGKTQELKRSAPNPVQGVDHVVEL